MMTMNNNLAIILVAAAMCLAPCQSFVLLTKRSDGSTTCRSLTTTTTATATKRISIISPPQSSVATFGNSPKRMPLVLPATSGNDDKEEDNSEMQKIENDDADGEILMKVQMSINDDEGDDDDAFNAISKFTQRFPFAAVLPVQPLQYLPMDDGGVDVRFLRKKTEEKGSIDGGIRFYVVRNGDDGNDSASSIEIVARRNSTGQSVPKIFSEKLVVLEFVSRIAAEGSIDGATMTSVFHRWM